MRSVEEQQTRVSAAAVAPRPVRVAIAEAQGLLCAEEVVTERPLPGFDQAAIDGYAVRSVDVLSVGEADSSDDHVDDEGEPGESSSARGGVTLPVMGSIAGRHPDTQQAAAGAGRARADRGADADVGGRGVAVALDGRRAVEGAGAARRALGCLRATDRR